MTWSIRCLETTTPGVSALQRFRSASAQLADGRLLAIGDVDHGLEAAGDAMGVFRVDQVPREGAVEVKAGEIEPDHLAELGQ